MGEVALQKVRMNKLAHVDSLRGIAILLVVFNHVAESIPGLPLVLAGLGYFGKYGVQLFFLMSAYTLSLSMDSRNDRQPLAAFFIRRYFRIAPLYYFGLLLYLLVGLFHLRSGVETFLPVYTYSPSEILSNVTFLHGLFPSTFTALVPGGWSIGTEMLFYILFPAIFQGYASLRRPVFLFIIPVATAFFLFVFFRALPHVFPPLERHNFEFYYCSVLNQAPLFLTGISLYFYTTRFDLRSPGPRFAATAAILGFGAVIVCRHFGLTDITLATFATGIAFVFLFFLVRHTARLNPAWLQYIGRLSFSIYVLHFLFAVSFTTYLSRWILPFVPPAVVLLIAFFISVAGSVLAARLTFVTIELPGLAAGKRVIKKINTQLKYDKN